MRTDPPAGDEFDLLLDRITQNVLRNAEAPVQLPAPVVVPKRRFRLGALVVSVLVVLGLGTAGGALAVGLNVFGSGETDAPPIPVPSTSSPAPSPSAPPTTTPPIPAEPTLSLGDDAFSPPDWGSGVTASLSGFAPDTDYALSLDSRYRGESGAPDGYFSIFSSPIVVTTDENGAATITAWIPDVFPSNFTGSGESGYLLGSYVRVDGVGGPQHDGSTSGFADPLLLSRPLTIEFLPIEAVVATAPSCIEPDQLVTGQAGLPVSFSGLLPDEIVFVNSVQTGGPTSYSFQGSGTADGSGNATIVVTGSAAMYPVSTSADIAPGAWQLRWSASDRQTPTAEHPDGVLPLTVGGC